MSIKYGRLPNPLKTVVESSPVSDRDYEAYQLDIISRWYRLRQMGKLYPLLQSGTHLYRFDPVLRWDDPFKTLVSWEDLYKDVAEAEGDVIITRKPVDSQRDRAERYIKRLG